MTAEKVSKLMEYLKIDRIEEVSGRKNNKRKLEIAVAKTASRRYGRRQARRVDILLETLTPSELTDLRTMLAIGKYKTYYSPGKYEPKKAGDLAAWRSYLDVKRMSPEASVVELRKMSAWAILEDLNAFIKASR